MHARVPDDHAAIRTDGERMIHRRSSPCSHECAVTDIHPPTFLTSPLFSSLLLSLPLSAAMASYDEGQQPTYSDHQQQEYNDTQYATGGQQQQQQQQQHSSQFEQQQQYQDPPAEIVVHETIRGLLRPAAAELIGSALFVFIACGSAMTTVGFTNLGVKAIGIAMTFGFTIFVLAYTIGHISGGHLNFAVTFTFCLLRKISILKAGLYFLAQFFGGLIGIGFLKLVTPASWWVSCFAANVVQPELTVGHAFVAEFILTFMLMWTVMAACDSSKSNQTLVPLAIGMAVFIAHMIALPITGCSINPTRTFASAAAASGTDACPNAWANHWVFWFAPILGASTAGIVYEYCFHEGGYKVRCLAQATATQYIHRICTDRSLPRSSFVSIQVDMMIDQYVIRRH